jgi:hypothetical protein
MPSAKLPTSSNWGHDSAEITPIELVERLGEHARHASQNYSALPDGPEPCTDRNGFSRVSVIIPLPETFFDQLMNGTTGYRAHYSVSIAHGEGFNRCLVDRVAPIIVAADHLYKDRFGKDLCQRSLLGAFSKFWFPKELTDPSAQEQLLRCDEEIRLPRWMDYWKSYPPPRKGLLAPIPCEPSVLLNGSFVNDAGEVYEQKHGRSEQLFESGWT